MSKQHDMHAIGYLNELGKSELISFTHQRTILVKSAIVRHFKQSTSKFWYIVFSSFAYFEK